MKETLVGLLMIVSFMAKADFIKTSTQNSSNGYLIIQGTFESTPSVISIIENLDVIKTVKSYNGHKKTRFTIRDKTQSPEQIFFEINEQSPEIISAFAELKFENFDGMNLTQLSFRNSPAKTLTDILIKSGGKVISKVSNGFPSMPVIRRELNVDLDLFHCFAVGVSNDENDTNPKLTNYYCSLKP